MKTLAVPMLSHKLLDQATELISTIQKFDHTYRTPYLSNQFNRFQKMNAFFLASEDDQLVGLLTLYADGELTDKVDVTINVQPNYRQQGIAKTLWQLAAKELQKYGFQSFEFMTEKAFLDKHPTFLIRTNLHANQESEYLMSAARPNQNNQLSHDLLVRSLQAKDVQPLSNLYSASLPEISIGVAQHNLEQAVNSVTTLNFVLTDGQNILGYCSLDNGEDYYFFDVVIASKYQNQGLGTALISEAMRKVYSDQPKLFSLSVKARNKAAHRAYRKAGFIDKSEVLYLEPNKDIRS